MRRIWLTLLLLIVTISSQTLMVMADDAPPIPLVTTNVVSKNVVGPHSVVPGPGGVSVTIANRYYPYYGGSVKTDGWAQGNFNVPYWARFLCQSHVFNSAGQQGSSTWSSGTYGGNSCPVTPQASLSGVVPTTYTSWTKAWWAWPDGTSGYGIAQQSHYES